MQIQLNAVELEAAVTQYLVSEGMDLTNKTTEFMFEGNCAINIEVDEDAVVEPKTKAKPKTRAKRKPKAELAPEPVAKEAPKAIKGDEEENRFVAEAKAEPVAEETVAVEEVVETLEEQTQPVVEEETPVAETKPNDNSIFA